MVKPKYLELNIGEKAIHCENCEMTIMNTLKQNSGVIRVNADHQTQKVQLYYDQEKINPSKIKYLKLALGQTILSSENFIEQRGENIASVGKKYTLIDNIPAFQGIHL